MSESARPFASLSGSRRVYLGSIAMVVGIALIGALGFVPVPSAALQVFVGVLGVAVMVAGVLLVGTSEGTV
ncbi:MAG: hypothetical protein V5A62_01030 [Haloarculaceae archaeon]